MENNNDRTQEIVKHLSNEKGLIVPEKVIALQLTLDETTAMHLVNKAHEDGSDEKERDQILAKLLALYALRIAQNTVSDDCMVKYLTYAALQRCDWEVLAQSYREAVEERCIKKMQENN